MVEGKLACSGTPSFLKKRYKLTQTIMLLNIMCTQYRYGVGYNLRVVLHNDDSARSIETIVSLICPKFEMHRVGFELQYLLPYEAMPQFSHLFEQLESENKRETTNSTGYNG